MGVLTRAAVVNTFTCKAMLSVYGIYLMLFLASHLYARGTPNRRVLRQIPDPDSETFSQPASDLPDLGSDSSFALEAEIAKRIRQGEGSDLNAAETGAVLTGLAGSLNPLVGLGLQGTLATRTAINDIIGTKLPVNNDRNKLIENVYGLNAGSLDPLVELGLQGTLSTRKAINDIIGTKLPLQNNRNDLIEAIYGLNTGSLDPLVGLGLQGTLARRKAINAIIGGNLPLKDERTELIEEIYGLNDPVITLQQKRRKALQDIYGFDSLRASLYDDSLGVFFSDRKSLLDRIYGLDTVTAERRLLRKILLQQRLKRIRNSLYRPFGIRN